MIANVAEGLTMPAPPQSLRAKLRAMVGGEMDNAVRLTGSARDQLAARIADAAIEVVRQHIEDNRVNPCTPRDFEGMLRDP